ncbi:hypothetical protein LXA43DRAFT_1097538 [Ganoderma leucocontextum]|nr:hypothetical protein LXA43DRAFT_1097538 [Ganoderma leucocontextum]
MAANTTSTFARPAFTLAGPVLPNTMPVPSESLSRRPALDTRIYHAHLRANIRRIQSLGLGLPPSMRAPQRTIRAVPHTLPTTTTTNPTIVAPTPRRALNVLTLNGLLTPPATPTPAPAPSTRPLLPTRRSRAPAARSSFHGTGMGLSFGLDVFGDDPVLTPRPSFLDDDVSRTPRAPTSSSSGSGGYFHLSRSTPSGEDATPPPASPDDGEVEGEEHVFRAI